MPSAEVANLDGYPEVQIARQMANCFKHSDGRASADLLSAWPASDAHRPNEGDRISYAAYPWVGTIDALTTMLRHAYRQLRTYCKSRDNKPPWW